MAHEDEVFKNFLVEMAERLAEFEQGLSELEQAYSVNVINLLFRAIHTIKGGAGFFGLNKITELTHLLEDLLMKIREGDVAFDPVMMPALYAACDSLNDMQHDASYGEQMDIAAVCLALHLDHIASGAPLVPKAKQEAPKTTSAAATANTAAKTVSQPIESESATLKAAEQTAREAPPAITKASDVDAAGQAKPQASNAQSETIRVKLDLLDRLMELTGEIVVARNQLLRQFAESNNKMALTSRPKKELVLALQQIGYDVLVTDSLHVSAEVQQHLAPDLMVVVIMEALLLQLSMNNTIKKTQV